ncbi:hypothetical protein HKD37_10G028445 [Glycine soja]
MQLTNKKGNATHSKCSIQTRKGSQQTEHNRSHKTQQRGAKQTKHNRLRERRVNLPIRNKAKLRMQLKIQTEKTCWRRHTKQIKSLSLGT